MGDYFIQASTFTAAGLYAGACLRVDPTMIISGDSDCMAPRFVSDREHCSAASGTDW